jgi:hypothetical protein
MKRMMLIGGMVGFGAATLCGVLTDGSSWPGILVRASLCALAGGLMMRWLAGVLAGCLREAHADRQAALAAAVANKAPAAAKPLIR